MDNFCQLKFKDQAGKVKHKISNATAILTLLIYLYLWVDLH